MIGWLVLLGWVGSGGLGMVLAGGRDWRFGVAMTGTEAFGFLLLAAFYAACGPVGLVMGLLARWEHKLSGR